jgi:guanosine-3',5'-bis(diphosphate) 3'-pyrophosphohydrolase
MNRLEFFDRIPAVPQGQRQRVQWAYTIAKRWHAGQSRDDGQRYFEHVRGVADILIDHGYDEPDDIILALLHDLLEDTYFPVSMLEQLFGPELTREVVAVSKTYGLEDPLTGFIMPTRKPHKEEYFYRVRRNGLRAMRAKCADRIYNLRDLVQPHGPESRWTPEKRLAQARETREWIIPLAKDADPQFAVQLEELCQKIEDDVLRNRSVPSTCPPT